MKVTLVGYTPRPLYVCAEAAAVCYDSEPSLNIIKGCIRSGHQSVLEHCSFTFKVEGISRSCFDRETEVLTNNGWKHFCDVENTDLIFTINQDTQKAEFQPILNQIKYKYNGLMHYYKSQNIDLLVTPNHNLYMKKYDVRVPDKYHLCPSEDIKVKRFYMKKTVNYDIEVDDYFTIPGYSYYRKNKNGELYEKTLSDLRLPRDNFYKLLAWYLAEGSTYYNQKENSYTISISQLKTQNIDHIMEIVSNCGLRPYYDGKSIRFKNMVLGKYFSSLGLSLNKKIPFDIFTNFNKKLSKIFIDEYILGDGTIQKDKSGKIFTISKELSEQIYNLCFIAGYTATNHIDNRAGQSHTWNGREIKHNYPCYIINISMTGKRNHEIVVKKDSHFSEIPFNDYVYCIEVPNHTLFVRRNGIACWCGNCSHQIVRHRIASYSQQSQRYVKYDDLDWVIPDYGIDGDFARHACDIMLNAYKEMTDESDPSFQKSTIDAARCVLPNATPTTIYVTMNLRALMHFCNERMCNRASKEIHEVASLMKEQVMWAENISIEEKTILSEILVPKCMAGPIHACPERDGCGKFKPLKEFVWRAKGRWIGINEWAQMHDSKPSGIGTYFWCSACEEPHESKSEFCPNCGAEMTQEG